MSKQQFKQQSSKISLLVNSKRLSQLIVMIHVVINNASSYNRLRDS